MSGVSKWYFFESCFATGSAFTAEMGGGGNQGFNMVNLTLYSAVFQLYSQVTYVST